jgi:hypothetical protein
MKRVFCVLAGGLLLAGLTFAQPLLSPVKVASLAYPVRWSQMAFSPDGVAHIIYEAMDVGSDHLIYYVSYDGTTASAPLQISGNGGKAERPGIGVGPNGTIAVVWGDSGSVYMRVYDPAQAKWLAIESVKQGYGGDEPSVCVDREGNTYVMWYEDGGGRIYSRAKINGAWEDSKRMDSQTTRATQDGIAMGRDGRIWGIWREKQGGGEYKGRYRFRTKTTGWSEVMVINDAGASWSHPGITVGPDNIPLVVTGDIDESSGTSQEMWIIVMNGQGNPREMIIPAVTQHYPRVAADKFGKYVACQLGGGDFGDGIRFTYKKAGSSAWSDVQTMGGAWPKIPGISADGYGNVAVCWSNIRFGEGADILLASFNPISKKQVYAPQTPAGSAVFETVNNVPKVTWTFSWGANSQNKDAEMDGYQIYRRFSGGSWEPVVFVDKSKLTATYSVTELPSVPEFAMVAVLLSGLESTKVSFPAIQYQLGTPLNASASYKLTGLKTTPMLKVDITWQPNSANNDAFVQGYNIYKKEGLTGQFKLFKEIAKGQTSASFTFDTTETKLQFGITTLTVFKLESSMVVLGPTQTQTGSSRFRLIGK